MDSNAQLTLFDRPKGGRRRKLMEPVAEEKALAAVTDLQQASHGYLNYSFAVGFDGEKNMGELGPIKNYFPFYEFLRLRSWQAMYESEIAQITINRYLTWVIGSGLKLQSEPNTSVLEDDSITLDATKFSDKVEARFQVYSTLRESDFAGMEDLNTQQNTIKKNAIVGGDVLVILRYDKGRPVTVQTIDGCHIVNPPDRSGNEFYAEPLANGNRIINGVEISPTGQHVAYYVREPGINYVVQRVEAVGKKTGLLMAFLVYGTKYRINNVRGLPLIAVMLETMKKLERYKEATVGSAEERQKIPYFVEHDLGSSGENPFAKQVATLLGGKGGLLNSDDNPVTIQGQKLADKVAATTNKMVFNMPIASTIKSVDVKNELYFKEFYSTNIDILCAAIEIPPNVAMQKYDSNFSSSRAALKDWEHTLQVKRTVFKRQCLQPIYNFWLHSEIIDNKVQAPGYMTAWFNDNIMVMGAYRMCRFVGATVPHIDPLKEVMAERAKLGPTGAAIPLGTAESATENLNGGDSDANMEQYARELKRSKTLGIELPQPPKPAAPPA